MTTTPRLTYTEVCKRIARRLIESSLNFRNQRVMDELVQCAETGKTGLFGFNLEVFGDDTSANIYVENVGRYSERGIRVNDDGDEVIDVSLEFKVNYPAHGSTEIEVVQSRLAFLKNVADVVSSLKQEFGEQTYERVIATKAEGEERKKRIEETRVKAIIQGFVNGYSKRLRVGKQKEVLLTAGVDELPQDTHRVTSSNGRTFTVVVNGLTAIVTRTA